MKKVFFILFIVLGLVACTKTNEEQTIQKWEYYSLIEKGRAISNFGENSIGVPTAKLDTLGSQGWELVDAYTRIETVHPNYGNEQYVTGLQSNTRTSFVVYVFKRPIIDGQRINSKEKSELIISE